MYLHICILSKMIYLVNSSWNSKKAWIFKFLCLLCGNSQFQMSPWHNKFNSLDENVKLKNSIESHRHYKGAPHSPLKYNCFWNKTL